ncbi:MAG: serine hydrolase [Chlamydia sp.]
MPFQLFLFCIVASLISSSAYSVESSSAIESIASHAGACIVINGQTGRVLFQKNAYEKRFPASCTKVATLAYVLASPYCDIKKKIIVPKEAVRIIKDSEKARDNFSKYPSYLQEMTGTSARFIAGEEITIEDALYGMMLISGNDAANTLAYHFGGGDIELFMKNLNRFLSKVGCKQTNFMNPHGLHHPDHISSAHDLALITLYGINTLPLFREIVQSTKYTKNRTNKQDAVVWTQSNRLLQKGPFFYEYATGVKTGRHMRAMENIIASGEREGRRIIAVFLQCQDRAALFRQAKKSLKLFLEEKKVKKTLISQGSIQLMREVLGHTPLQLKVRDSFEFHYFPSESPQVRTVVDWYPLPLSIKKDECIGEIQFFLDNKEAKKMKLYALEAKKPTLLSLLYFLHSTLHHFFSQKIVQVCAMIISLCTLFFLFVYLAQQKRRR